MLCTENGVLNNSQYFFFAPTDIFKEYYPYIINCGHFYCQDGYKVQREGHHSPLLLYMLGGKLHLEYNARQYLAQKGDIILIDGNKKHSYYATSSCEFIYMHYLGSTSLEITRQLLKQNGTPIFQLPHAEEVFFPLFQLLNKLYTDNSATDIELSCTIFEALCRIQTFNTSSAHRASANSHIIEAAVSFIRKNLTQSITLQNIARHVNLSPYYFAHLFKAETGYTPIEYTALCKINLAKTMLKTTNQSISHIAEHLGYSSSASFINAFVRRTGITPLKYRCK